LVTFWIAAAVPVPVERSLGFEAYTVQFLVSMMTKDGDT
jgi:hypothetical protein